MSDDDTLLHDEPFAGLWSAAPDALDAIRNLLVLNNWFWYRFPILAIVGEASERPRFFPADADGIPEDEAGLFFTLGGLIGLAENDSVVAMLLRADS